MAEDFEIHGISGNSVLKIKLKTFFVFIVSIFTFMITIAGWLMKDYSNKISEAQTKIEKMDEKIDQITSDVQFIRGQLEEIARPAQTNPTNIHIPTNTPPPEN